MILDKVINQTKILSTIIVILFILLVISLASNLFLSYLVYYQRNEIRTVIIPLANQDNSEYKLTNSAYSNKYLRDMGISFVSLRLNVTPEKVVSSHKLLLSYVADESRKEIADVLSKEEKIIIKDDLTSSFYMDKINLYPDSNVFEVVGVLRTWSGKNALEPQKKKYQLQVKYTNSGFEIVKFIEVKIDEK